MRTIGAFFALSAQLGSGESCYLPIDLMFVQDTTGSFVEDLPNVSKNIPKIIEAITTANPGSYFGIAQFKDKPYHELGEADDFCYQLAQPLTASVDEFQKSWDLLYASGGGDLPEAQLHALIDVATDPAAKWRQINNAVSTPNDQFVGAKLIVVSTDAVSHDEGDYELYLEDPLPTPPLPPSFMPRFPENFLDYSVDTRCKVYDYPTFPQAAKVLKDNNIMVVFLVPEIERGAVSKWMAFNNNILNQPPNFVQFISSDSSDIVEVLTRAVHTVTEYVCNTTTPPPTTPVPTTAPATTAPATTTPAPTTTPTTTTPAPTTTTPAPTTTTPAPTTTTPAPTTTTPAPTTTTPAPTTTTPAPTTTTPAPTTTTPAPTTTTPVVATVSSAGGVETTTAPGISLGTPVTRPFESSSGPAVPPVECVCPPGAVDCACVPALVVRVNNRPKSLIINYEK